MRLQTKTERSDERGLAHVALVLIVLVVLGVIGYAGYTVYQRSGVGKKASTTTTKTTDQTEAAAADQGCVDTYKDANLCKFADKGGKLESLAFKATATSTGANAGIFTLLNDGKGNSQFTGAYGGSEVTAINSGGHTYFKSGDSWVDYGVTTNDNDPTKEFSVVLGSGTTFTPQGKEACGSMMCFKYDLKDSSSPDDQQTVWFDTANYLARKWTDVTTDGNGQTATTMIISYQKVTISKPSPVTQLNQ